MIGLVLGETQLGNLIIQKLKLLKKNFLIIDLSKKKIFKKNKNFYPLTVGQLGKAIRILKQHKCKKIIFAGRVKIPNFRKTKFDFKALYYLPKIIKSAKKGDSSIIKTIIQIFKKEGFKVISSITFNSELTLKKGNCTKIKPNNLNKKDITKGKYALHDLTNNPKTGQAIIIINGYVVGIEDLNGTDYMIKKTKNFIKKFSSKRKKQGVLLKFPKKNQDLRIDLPTIGIKTIKDCAKLNLKGIVLKANHNIFLDRIKCINLANKNKMFICAI